MHIKCNFQLLRILNMCCNMPKPHCSHKDRMLSHCIIQQERFISFHLIYYLFTGHTNSNLSWWPRPNERGHLRLRVNLRCTQEGP